MTIFHYITILLNNKSYFIKEKSVYFITITEQPNDIYNFYSLNLYHASHKS